MDVFLLYENISSKNQLDTKDDRVLHVSLIGRSI